MIVSVCVRYIKEVYSKSRPNDIEIEIAQKYRQDLLDFFIEKYSYLLDECDVDYVNREEMMSLYTTIVKVLLDEYLERTDNTNYLIQDFMKGRLKTIAKNNWWNQCKTGSVQKLIDKARNGDVHAKKMLIERYMYIVDLKIQEFNFSRDEETYQIGYLVLSQVINDYLDNNFKIDLVSYIYAYFSRNYFSTMNKMKTDESNYIYAKKLLKAQLLPEEDLYEQEIEKADIFDCINRLEHETEKKIMIDIFNGYTQTDIAQKLNFTRSNVSLYVIRARNNVKEIYEDDFEKSKKLTKKKKGK